MARTKASVGAKVSSGKSSKARAVSAPPPPSPSTSSGRSTSSRTTSHGGGNPVCPRETPVWQKPITNFFINGQTKETTDSDQEAGSSNETKKRKKLNVIDSDSEGEIDKSETLAPLNGESSHKIAEYFNIQDETSKGNKGKGKKTKQTDDKENKSLNKRDIDDIANGDSLETSSSKRIRLSA